MGKFVKVDPANMTGGWKLYKRIRVTMKLEKLLRRRMKIKREEGEWSWLNFKYDRLSTFCFVCCLFGHADRDCGIVYANHSSCIWCVVESTHAKYEKPESGGKMVETWNR